jgi:hypothetical protein
VGKRERGDDRDERGKKKERNEKGDKPEGEQGRAEGWGADKGVKGSFACEHDEATPSLLIRNLPLDVKVCTCTYKNIYI